MGKLLFKNQELQLGRFFLRGTPHSLSNYSKTFKNFVSSNLSSTATLPSLHNIRASKPTSA
jgi:hypothetical protein